MLRNSQIAALLRRIWWDQSGQDVAEYGIMLALLLVITIGIVQLIGTHAKEVFSQVSRAIAPHSGD
ncbi:MAG TPA: hypothetical protein VJX16_25440 [Terriglobales bacterium]|nr:hypothetical protein [Terriglobales bacterium]